MESEPKRQPKPKPNPFKRLIELAGYTADQLGIASFVFYILDNEAKQYNSLPYSLPAQQECVRILKAKYGVSEDSYLPEWAQVIDRETNKLANKK